MRVLVTGGSGLVGRWVIKELAENGYEVVYADRQRAMPYDDDPTAEILAATRFVACDMLNIRQVGYALDGCEGVIHLAAYPTPLGRPAEETFTNNTQATFHVLQAAMERGIQRAVIADWLVGSNLPCPPPATMKMSEDTTSASSRRLRSIDCATGTIGSASPWPMRP